MRELLGIKEPLPVAGDRLVCLRNDRTKGLINGGLWRVETLRPMRDRANEVYQIVDAAYRETGSDLLRLLDAERTKIEAALAYARALAELQQSAVALETAQGNLP